MYLDGPRFTFSGDFCADVSTVNNDVRHYDNASFQARFQQPRQGAVMNGWWNPGGGAAFDFVGCTVRSATYRDATTTADPGADPIISAPVSGPTDRSSGKMVDLDPQAQMYSELWGVALRVGAPGDLVVEGELLPPSFRDLQQRQFVSNPNGQGAGASWTGVLRNLRWGSGSSRLAAELREVTSDGQLAVNLTAFGYYYAHADGRFSMGRLLGVVGPYVSGEPQRFAPARRLVGSGARFGYSNVAWDAAASRITVDLGGSFPLQGPMGDVLDIGTLELAVAGGSSVPTTADPSSYRVIGAVDYQTPPDWLMETAGMVSLPVDADAAALLDGHQVLLVSSDDGVTTIEAIESTSGLTVRADNHIHRLDPGDSAAVRLHATQWGKPLAAGAITLSLAAPAQSGGGPGSDPQPPSAPIPSTNHPSTALTFNATATTGTDGTAVVTLDASDPGNPRGYIDGQLYQVNYGLAGLDPADQYFLDQIVVHVRGAFTSSERPTWEDISETLVQYGNLYPAMSGVIVDLGDRDAVLANRRILLHAFRRDMAASDHMPATRDLSRARLEAIVSWLEDPDEPGRIEARERRQALPAAVDPSELGRRPAITMSRTQYEVLTGDGEGGKIDALRGLGDSIELTDE